jgi:hypothetical protein
VIITSIFTFITATFITAEGFSGSPDHHVHLAVLHIDHDAVAVLAGEAWKGRGGGLEED